MSDDGQVVAFSSLSALVPGDVDDEPDVYIWREGASPQLELVSQGTGGTGTPSSFGALTPNGRHVLFTSADRTLVVGDDTAPGSNGLYLRDLTTATTTLESRFNVSLGGGALPSGVYPTHNMDLSDDANTIVFLPWYEDPNGSVGTGVFVRDRSTGVSEDVLRSVGDAPVHSHSPTIDAAGRFVALEVDWDQVMAQGQTSDFYQVAVVDLSTGATQLASHNFSNPDAEGDGQSGPAYISADGRTVVYTSMATNLLATPFADSINRAYRYEVIASEDPTPTDALPPNIVITSPADGAKYQLGEAVFVDYVCDDAGGSGVATCAGDVPAGDALDTSTVGLHAFTVNAEDNEGNVDQVSVTYEVVAAGDTDAPVIWLNVPADGAVVTPADGITAFYECDDFGGSGVATCAGPVPSGSPIDVSSPGPKSFEVVATDNAGNESSEVVEYFVDAPGPPPADGFGPQIVIRTPLDKQRYGVGSAQRIDFECTDSEPGASGVASCTGSRPVGEALPSVEGTHTFTVQASDNAGNTTSRTVEYSIAEDSDGDGLSDLWETEGIDVDHDGAVDLRLDLPPYSADPAHKDLYVETDWMECGLAPSTCSPGHRASHGPTAGVVEATTAAFAGAPLTNPDGTTGVRLHLTVDQAVPEILTISFSTAAGAYDDYDDIKLGPPGPCNGAFGTNVERASVDCEDVLAAKSLVYRYALWGHSYSQYLTSSGIAEFGGNDFIVTLGGSEAWALVDGGLLQSESGTFLHELGHNLAFNHGGSDNTNCKPNYLSVMNYTMQVTQYLPDRPLDYSRAALPTLTESALVEADGIGGPAGQRTVFGRGTARPVALADAPIDWNGDGDTVDTVIGDPNSVRNSCTAPSPGETLRGSDDWQNVRWGFWASPDNASGSHFSALDLAASELTSEEVIEGAASTDADGDGFSNLADVCPSVPDPGQGNVDGDEDGDACDSLNAVNIAVAAENGNKIMAKDNVRVTMYATPTFNPGTQLVQAQLRFGRLGSEATLVRCLKPADLNRDQRQDLTCIFKLNGGGFATGQAAGILKGTLVGGAAIRGTASFLISK